MAIEILRPGPLTTVQDLGRAGHAAEGYAECGACDRRAYAVANIMAGNARPLAALECTLYGPLLRFTEDAVAAVGGGARPLRNGAPVRANFPLLLRAGDELDIGPIDGLRAYVAVLGGIDVPAVLGSRSTDLRCHIGGLEGRALRAGDALPVPRADAAAAFARLSAGAARVRLPDMACARGGVRVARVIPGPQDDAFTPEGLAAFYGGTYTVGANSDRMGLRLDGPAAASVHGTDILSDGILTGSVQISADGRPIVMLADHQTAGGYAKIATVVPTDLPMLAQLRPGEALRFEAVTRQDAAAWYRGEAELLKRMMEEMRDDVHSGSERGPGRELWRLQHRDGRSADPVRHVRQHRLRLSRR